LLSRWVSLAKPQAEQKSNNTNPFNRSPNALDDFKFKQLFQYTSEQAMMVFTTVIIALRTVVSSRSCSESAGRLDNSPLHEVHLSVNTHRIQRWGNYALERNKTLTDSQTSASRLACQSQRYAFITFQLRADQFSQLLSNYRF